jgi:hypothetical protein
VSNFLPIFSCAVLEPEIREAQRQLQEMVEEGIDRVEEDFHQKKPGETFFIVNREIDGDR